MAKEKAPAQRSTTLPDQRTLTEREAQRLGAIAGVDAAELAGHAIADLAEKFRFRIDPSLFFFRRICGRVVKKDPVTGLEYPVPNATVYVEDTDCTFLSYFPKGHSWAWHFPLFCHREVLATVHTDQCGNFCAYIPWFDIDWILRWRRERICFPIIFRRPWLKDLVDGPIPFPVDPGDPFNPQGPTPVGPRPGPGPDPSPIARLLELPLGTVEAIAGTAGRKLAERLRRASADRSLGKRDVLQRSALEVRAFDTELPPPLPRDLQKLRSGAGVIREKGADPVEAIRSSIAAHVGTSAKAIEKLDLARYIGPFLRCIDIFVPEWQLIIDVPDITFRVTQDVDGDGDEEVIYSEGYFDVRWDAGVIPDVTLVASSIAKESHTCDTPIVPCKNTPELLFAGLMPITDPAYFDSVNGFAVRPNKPQPSGAGTTPFWGALQLYGCVNVPNAAFYRVLLSTDGGTTFSAMTGLQWNIYPIPFGAPHTVVADSNGWYPVLPNPTDFHPANMVIEWPTPPLGKYTLKIETGTAAKAHLGFGNVVSIQVDNTYPTVLFTKLSWKFATESPTMFDDPSRNLLVPCPTIRRGSPARDIEVRFEVLASANHLRDATLYSHGCGGGAFSLSTPPAATTHWFTGQFDNSATLQGTYTLSAGALEGAYGFGCVANSRAINPSGADGGHLADWNYNHADLVVTPEVEIAIVNA